VKRLSFLLPFTFVKNGLHIIKIMYNPVFDSYTYKNPSKILINSALFEGLFALKM